MNEFKLGWKIVLTSMLGIAFCGSNVLLYAIGAIAPELSEEYGWSHGAIQFASLISISLLRRMVRTEDPALAGRTSSSNSGCVITAVGAVISNNAANEVLYCSGSSFSVKKGIIGSCYSTVH